MSIVTLYKANCITSNSRFEKYAIDEYLAGCEFKTLAPRDDVQPNVSFYIVTTESLYDLQGYNYMTYTTNGVTYYAIILNVQRISSNARGNNGEKTIVVRIDHALDIVAMYGTGLFDNADGTECPVIGDMSRGHVNDLRVDKSTGAIYGTPKNYMLSMEEAICGTEWMQRRWHPNVSYTESNCPCIGHTLYLEDGTTTTISAINIVGFLYVYVANPNGLFHDASEQNKSSYRAPMNTAYESVIETQGVVLAYPLYTPFTVGVGYTGPTKAVWKRNVTTSTDTSYGIESLINFTNGQITSMWFSRAPINNLRDYNGDISFCDLQNQEDLGIPEGGFYINMAPTRVNYIANGVSADSSLPRLYWHNYTITTATQLGDEVDDFEGNSYVSDYTLSLSKFSDYLESYIVKAHSSPYNNISIYDNARLSLYIDNQMTEETAASYGFSLEFLPDIDLSSFVILDDNYVCASGGVCAFSEVNMAIFAPTVVLDYWTRLNATQESIQAQKAKTNSIISGITGIVSGAANIASSAAGFSMGSSMIGASGSTQSALKAETLYNGGIQNASNGVGGIVGGVGQIAQSIANMAYDTEYYNNAKEIAEHQYETGQTTGNSFTGFSTLYTNEDVPAITSVCLTNKAHMKLCYRLHLQGYDCNIPLNLLYYHKRQLFNYIKSSNYTRLDVTADVMNEFRQMFAMGVWIFHKTPSNAKNKFNEINLPLYLEDDK